MSLSKERDVLEYVSSLFGFIVEFEHKNKVFRYMLCNQKATIKSVFFHI